MAGCPSDGGRGAKSVHEGGEGEPGHPRGMARRGQVLRRRLSGLTRHRLLDIAAYALAIWLDVMEESQGVRLVGDSEFPTLCQWAKSFLLL
jgi:hypothetical protein